jgi:cellulose synthase/poly-beta-1,6-N-acetylglucosamine synthase-like glycosyltransferase
MNFWWILYIIDVLLFVPITLTVVYLLVFAIAAMFKSTGEQKKAKQQNRYIVLIPSYKSDKKILETVNSILGQTYSQRNFDVVVISDHQNEMINMRLAQLPITLLTPNFERSTKVKALQYAILNLPQFKIYDAVIMLDAGNLVDPEFLEQVNDAFTSAGTKAIQTRRMARNLDTPIARMDAVFEEINNSIFRRGHLAIGLSSALNSSGSVFDFNWFKRNIMKIRSSVGEEKELEAMLLREGIYIDYFEDIHVYDEKTRLVNDFNNQRGRWTYIQLHNLLNNIRFMPIAIMNSQYDMIDKIFQWILIPRTVMMGLITIMSIVLPFIYFTLAIKWWIIAAIALFAFSLATPDYLVGKDWDKDFLRAPLITIGAIRNIFRAGKDEAGNRLDAFSHLVRKLKFKASTK